jgi:hypothetical protein
MDTTNPVDKLMAQNLTTLAQEGQELYTPSGRIRRQKGITRADVIQTFAYAFEMIGGTPRLAVWADSNPTDFFKLYGRLLPSSSSAELDGVQELIIRHALPPPKTDPTGTP